MGSGLDFGHFSSDLIYTGPSKGRVSLQLSLLTRHNLNVKMSKVKP